MRLADSLNRFEPRYGIAVNTRSSQAASQRSIAVFRRPKSSASSPRHERGSPSARSTASTTNDRQREAAFAMADTSGEQSAAAASEAPFTDAPADGWVQRRPARTDDAAAQRWRTRIEKCLNEPLRAPGIRLFVISNAVMSARDSGGWLLQHYLVAQSLGLTTLAALGTFAATTSPLL